MYASDSRVLKILCSFDFLNLEGSYSIMELASLSKDVNGRYFSKKWQWNVRHACKKKNGLSEGTLVWHRPNGLRCLNQNSKELIW